MFYSKIRVQEALKPQGWIKLIFIYIENVLNFLTLPLKGVHQLVYIQKITFIVLETPSTPIFRLLETSRADWDKNPKVWGTKNWKSVKGVCRVLGPLFLNEKQGIRSEKPFENWMRVSG